MRKYIVIDGGYVNVGLRNKDIWKFAGCIGLGLMIGLTGFKLLEIVAPQVANGAKFLLTSLMTRRSHKCGCGSEDCGEKKD